MAKTYLSSLLKKVINFKAVSFTNMYIDFSQFWNSRAKAFLNYLIMAVVTVLAESTFSWCEAIVTGSSLLSFVDDR